MPIPSTPVIQLLVLLQREDDSEADETAMVVVVNKSDLSPLTLPAYQESQPDYAATSRTRDEGTMEGGSSNSDSVGNGRTTSPSAVTAMTLVDERATPVILTSLTRGDGLEELVVELTESVKRLCGNPLTDSPTYTQSRHRNHLTNCRNHLGAALASLDNDIVIAAESLRLACVEIGQITGQILADDILDVVFRDFCIGK